MISNNWTKSKLSLGRSSIISCVINSEMYTTEDSGKPAKEERKELGKGALARRRGEEGKRGHRKDSANINMGDRCIQKLQ